MARPGDRSWVLATRLAIAIGVLLSLVQVARVQAGGDQFYQYVRGWMFAYGGWWVPFGVHTSSGGFSPGGLTSFLNGLPLLVWQDHRAIAAFGLVAHGLAGWALLRACAPALGARGRFLLVLLWWCNPWRLHYSTFAWTPNWMLVLGAIHLATARRMADRAAPLATFVHALTACLGVQIHNAFLILPLASVLLAWKRVVRVHVPGALAGAAAAAATLVPWVRVAIEHPEVLPIGGQGFLGRGLVTVYPLLRGVLYLLRYPSFALGRDVKQFDFGPALGARADAVLAPAAAALVAVAGVASVALALVALVRLWRRAPRAPLAALPPGAPPRSWLAAYARWTLLAAVVAFALSPTTTMAWQGFPAFHAAVLPLVLLGEAALRSPRRKETARRTVVAASAIAALFGLAVAFGSPMYRRGGRDAMEIRVREVPPFLEALGVPGTATVVIDPKAETESQVLLGPDRWHEGLEAGRAKM